MRPLKRCYGTSLDNVIQPGFNEYHAEMLRILCESLGFQVIRITTDSSRFAFVEMTNQAEAMKAIEGLNGQELNGRALNVNEARPRPERGGFGGGGGNRGGGGGYGGGGGRRREPRW